MPTLTDIRQQFPQYNDLPDEQLLAGLHRKFYADLPFDDFLSKVGASEEPGFVDNIVGSGKRGLLSAEQAMVTDAAATGMVSPEAAGGYIADTQQQIDEIPVPESVQRFFGTETWSDAAVEFVQSPLEITSTLVAQSLGTSIPSFAGAAVGAGAGSLAGPGGAVAGGAIGLGAGSAATETGAKILESFAEQGVDLTDPAQVTAAFANDELMESVRGDAVKRGVTIGVFDAVSGAIAGRLVAGARGVGSAVARGTGEVGIQSGLGMAGEAAGSAVIGDPISPPDVLAEGLGEIGTGGVEVAAGTAVRGLGAAGRARRGDEPVIRRPERVEDPYYTDEIVPPAEPEADVGPEVTPDAVPPETAAPVQEAPSGIAEAASPVLPGPEAVVEATPAPQQPAPSETPDPIQRTAQAVAQLPQGQPISRALIQRASGLKGNMQVRAILAAMENAGYAEKRGDRYVSTGRASAASGGTGAPGPTTEAVAPEPIETTPENPLPEVVPEMTRPEPGTRVRVLGQDGSEFGTATVAGDTDASRPRVRFVEGGVGPVKQPFADLVRMEPVEEMPQPGGLDPAAEQAAAAPTGSLSPDQAPPLAAPEAAEPPRRAARPRSAPVPLFQFIRDQGGIDPSDPLIGDVRASLDKQTLQLLRKPTAARTGVGGRRLDDLRGAAVQAGYLPEDATIADFLDAIQEDASRQQEGQTRVYRDDDMAEVVEREQAAKESREAERYLARFPSLDVAESYVESVRDLENAVEEADRRLDEIEADIAEQTREVLNGEWSPEERPDDANIPFEWIAEREGREVEGAGGETASAGETGSEPGGGQEADRTGRDAGDGGEQAGGPGEPEGVATEQTDQGEQILTPGVRPVTDKDRAETKAAKPLRSDKAQKPADDGLFDVAGRGQGDLLSPSAREEQVQREEARAAIRRGEAPGNERLQAYLDTLEDPSTYGLAGYSSFIHGVAEEVRRRRSVTGETPRDLQDDITRAAREKADAALSDRVKASQGFREDGPPTSTTPDPADYVDHWQEAADRLDGIEGVDARAAAADAWVLEKGQQTGHEYIAVLDKSGALLQAGTIGSAAEISFNGPALDRMMDAGADLVVTHNHPSGQAFSPTDLSQLALPGIDAIRVSAARADYVVRLADSIRGQFDGDWRRLGEIVRKIDRMLKARTLAAMEAGRITSDEQIDLQGHGLNLLLHRLGITTYETTLPVDALSDAYETVLNAAMSMARSIARQIPNRTERRPHEAGYLPYRHAKPVRSDRGVGGVREGVEGSSAAPDRGEVGDGGRARASEDRASDAEDISGGSEAREEGGAGEFRDAVTDAYAETNPGHDIVDDATKAREESVGFHRRVIARMDRFLNPIEGLPEIRSYLAERYRTFGKIAQVQDVAGHLTEPFEKASKADSEAVYEYMTTKDASPDAIANRGVREAAVKAKRAVDKIGRQLVAKGLLRQEAYDRHKDAYLPRVYLRHLLEKQGVAGSATVTAGGKKVSDLGYLKQRKDIDENTRRFILGEILDPKYLASRALVKPARDIALLDFLDHVAKNERWIIPQSVVSWNGQRVTAAWLKSEAATLRRMTDHQSAEDAAVTSEIAKSMEAAAEDALREFGIRNSDISDYRQVPDAPRYGRMRGLWVRKEIHEDLVGSTQWVTGDGGNFAQRLLSQGGTLTKATQLWKLGKVALNPPTQIRNAFSNAIMLHLSGVNGMMVIPRLIEAVQDMRAKGEYFQVARRYGITEATFAHNELFRLEGDLKEAMERSGSPMAKVAHMLGKIGNAAGDIYQGVESAFKIAKIIDEMKKGRTAETAALEAQKWLFDYSLVSGSTQYLRNAPLGVPFITYYTKVMPRLVEVAATKPWKLAPYVALPAALAAWVAAEYDVDQEDLDKLREALPTWLRNRGGGVIPLPYRDGNGNWQFVDLSYFFPWAMFEGLARAGASGDVTEFLSQAGILGGPVPQIISALQTGIDPFSEKPIVDEFDRPAKKLASLLNFAWSLSMPPWMTEYGFANRLYEAMSGTVDPRTGKPRYTEGQAMLRAVGVNVYPIDPVASRASNIRRMKFEVSEVKSRMRRELRDKNLTPDQRRAIVADYREMLAARVEQMREYAAASQVNPKLLRP